MRVKELALQYLNNARVIQSMRGKITRDFNNILDFVDNTDHQNTQSIFGSFRGSLAQLFLFTLIISGFFVVTNLALSKSITAPIKNATKILYDISQGRGDLTQRIPIESNDEIGEMVNYFNNFMDKLHQIIVDIAKMTHQLSSAAIELTNNSNNMHRNADESASQANVVSSASEEVSQSVDTVASGVEEMSASIQDIAKNALEASRVANSAVEIAKQTNQTVTQLADSSTEIGNVIKVINSIAEQTNLLALNATIEAARAGEAGKGFAVVANEVKELAKETGKATEDISLKIEAIQNDSKNSAEAIAKISDVINQINGISNTIASAVEEQTATTNEISRSIAEVAEGSQEITRNICGVADAAVSTSSGAKQAQMASKSLTEIAKALEKTVDQFKF